VAVLSRYITLISSPLIYKYRRYYIPICYANVYLYILLSSIFNMSSCTYLNIYIHITHYNIIYYNSCLYIVYTHYINIISYIYVYINTPYLIYYYDPWIAIAKAIPIGMPPEGGACIPIGSMTRSLTPARMCYINRTPELLYVPTWAQVHIHMRCVFYSAPS
jgi:hypothetical protein